MDGGIIGVSDHGGWAVLVTVAADGAILDRRRVELVDDTLPALPHHHEGQLLAMNEAVALVERVRVSAERHAILALDEVATAVPHILGIALRKRPQTSGHGCRTNQGLSCAKRCRLGDVPRSSCFRRRGARLADPLVPRKGGLGFGEPGVARREFRGSLSRSAPHLRAAMEQGSQACDGGGHRHGGGAFPLM